MRMVGTTFTAQNYSWYNFEDRHLEIIFHVQLWPLILIYMSVIKVLKFNIVPLNQSDATNAIAGILA